MNDYIIEKLLILSCNIDDFNPQNYEYISQKLFEHNALDVWQIGRASCRERV